jgi:putative flippase GtrA
MVRPAHAARWLDRTLERGVTRAAQGVPVARPDVLVQFARFGVVGGIGFVFDTATVYALAPWLGLIGAGLAAYLVAASVTRILNRQWTFRDRAGGHDGIHAWIRQWSRFLAANAVGFVLNRGTYIILVSTIAVCARYPVLAVAAGCLAGMVSNFRLSRAYVFH